MKALDTTDKINELVKCDLHHYIADFYFSKTTNSNTTTQKCDGMYEGDIVVSNGFSRDFAFQSLNTGRFFVILNL